MSDSQYLENLVKGIVEFPDKVKVFRSVDEMGVLMSVDVAKEDMGKIIGREGNTAKAVQNFDESLRNEEQLSDKYEDK
jgi:predicted RNA-binding protein YlqC (UPF0109 family)